MSKCVFPDSPEFKDLTEVYGETTARLLHDKYKGEIPSWYFMSKETYDRMSESHQQLTTELAQRNIVESKDIDPETIVKRFRDQTTKLTQLLENHFKNEDAKGKSFYTKRVNEAMTNRILGDIEKTEIALRDSLVSVKEAFEDVKKFQSQDFEDMKDKREKFSAVHELNMYANAFNPVINDMVEQFRTLPESNEFVRNLDELKKYKSKINDIYYGEALSYLTDLLSNMVSPELIKSGEEYIAEENNRFNKYVDYNTDLYHKAVQKGNTNEAKKYQDKIREVKARIDKLNRVDAVKYILTKENLRAYVDGTYGDASAFSTFWDAVIHNTHPEIAGFAKLVHDKLNNVRSDSVDRQNRFQTAIWEYNKAIGASDSAFHKSNNIREFYKPITQESELEHFKYNEDTGEIESDKAIEPWLLQEFSPQFISDRSKLFANIHKAEHEGNEQGLIRAKQALSDWLTDNFEQEYKDEVYKAKAILNEQDGIAKIRRREIFDRINAIKLTRGAGMDYSIGQIDELYRLNRERLQLASTVDVLGNPKTGVDLEIANILQKYNKAMSEFYDSDINDEDFQRAVKLKKEQYGEDSPEYNKWYEKNTRKTPTQAWFDKRKELFKLINLYKGKSDATLDSLWEKIREITLGYRDEDGTLIGEDFTPDAKNKIKDYQEKIEDIKSSIAGADNLTKKEKFRRQEIYNNPHNLYPREGSIEEKRMWWRKLSEDDQQFLLELRDKSTEGSFSDKLSILFRQLAELQDRQETENYREAVQRVKEEIAADLSTPEELVSFDSEKVLDEYFKSDWYKKNHFSELKYDSELKSYYEDMAPLYVWTKIVPIDPDDYTISPSSLWSKPKLKDSLKNPNYKLDIKGNEIPKQGKYTNPEYEALKSATDPKSKSVFKFLNFLTDEYLKSQENLPENMRLGHAIPKIEDHSLLNRFTKRGLSVKGIAEGAYHLVGDLWADFFKKNPRDIERDIYRDTYATEDDSQSNFIIPTALADLQGNEFQYIPIHYRSKIDAEDQSYDLAGSILKFAFAADNYGMLNNLHTEADAFQDVFSKYRPTTGNVDAVHMKNEKIANRGALGTIKDTATGLIKEGASKAIEYGIRKKGESVREAATREYIKQVFYGEYSNPLPFNIDKALQFVFHLVGFSKLVANYPADATNYLDAKLELIVEAAGKDFFDVNDLKEADRLVNQHIVSLLGDTWQWTKPSKNIVSSEFSQDMWREGQKSLIGQILDKYGVIQGEYEDEVGHNITATKARILFSTSPLFFFRNLGEYSAQAKLFFAKANRTFISHENGSKVKFLDAWEKDKDGNLKLKDGYIWTDKQRDNLISTVGERNRALNGNYHKLNRALVEKGWVVKMVMVMKRYLVTKGMNRYQDPRASLETQRVEAAGYSKSIWNALVIDTWKYQSKLGAARNAATLALLPVQWLTEHSIPFQDTGIAFIDNKVDAKYTKGDYLSNFSKYDQDKLTTRDKANLGKFVNNTIQIYTLFALTQLLVQWAITDRKKVANNMFVDKLARLAALVVMKTSSERGNFTPTSNIGDIYRLRHQPLALTNDILDTGVDMLQSALWEGAYLSLHTIPIHAKWKNEWENNAYEGSHFTTNNRLAKHNAGDLKAKKYLLKVLGYTGNTMNPQEAIENFNKIQSGSSRR